MSACPCGAHENAEPHKHLPSVHDCIRHQRGDCAKCLAEIGFFHQVAAWLRGWNDEQDKL